MPQRVIWCFSDGKPGHEAQSQGLIAALNHPPGIVICHTIITKTTTGRLSEIIRRRLPEVDPRQKPALLIGTGRRTHLAMLAARWRYGGRIVVLMKPDLPRSLFDLCIIPEHDGVTVGNANNILTTTGALNPMQRSIQQDPQRGLILIGGPSTHHGWSQQQIIEQLQTIASASSGVRWTLTTSRRTPADFLATLNTLNLPDVHVVPYTETGPGWVQQQLRDAAQVWVSEDSVSMIYEALTAGTAVGLLRLPALRESRIIKGVNQLIEQNWVTGFQDWRPGTRLTPPAKALAEAERCARWIEQHWFESGYAGSAG